MSNSLGCRPAMAWRWSFATARRNRRSARSRLREALKKHPEIPVRMGIHSGPVSEVTDVNGRSNIAGAGINLAQRVMDCGDAGHILLSQRVADDLAQYRQWSSRLHDLGECEVKHGVRLHVLNLYTEELGNPAVPEKFKKRRKSKPRPAVSSRRVPPPKSRWPLVLAALVTRRRACRRVPVFLASTVGHFGSGLHSGRISFANPAAAPEDPEDSRKEHRGAAL